MAYADYEGRMAQVYDAGRRLPSDSVNRWMHAAAGHLGSVDAPLIDLGAGTGRFSAALADRFGVLVLALEPATAMRRQARENTLGHRVRVLGARAEALPVRDQSVAAVWASMVLHHVSDLRTCARELRRVLSTGGPVLIRALVTGAPTPTWMATYFPGVARLATQRFPSFEYMVDVFAAAGLRVAAHDRVQQTIADGLTELRDRVQLRADTGLAMLPDEEFQDGLVRLKADAAAETESRPVVEELDLVVLR